MWSLGVLIGLPILALLLVLCLAAIALGIWLERTDGDGLGLALGGFLAALLFLGIAALPGVGYYPYDREYHRWEETSGTIAQVNDRFLGNGKSTTQRFVVRFKDGRERSCDDTRCSLLEPGDRLTLSCKREWQYAGEDGWSCNYVRRGGAE